MTSVTSRRSGMCFSVCVAAADSDGTVTFVTINRERRPALPKVDIYTIIYLYIYICGYTPVLCVRHTMSDKQFWHKCKKAERRIFIYIYFFFFPQQNTFKIWIQNCLQSQTKKADRSYYLLSGHFFFFSFFFFYSTLQNSYRHKNQNREEETLSYAFKCVAVYRMEDSGCRISPPNVNDLWSFLSRMKWSGHKTWSDTISA